MTATGQDQFTLVNSVQVVMHSSVHFQSKVTARACYVSPTHISFHLSYDNTQLLYNVVRTIVYFRRKMMLSSGLNARYFFRRLV